MRRAALNSHRRSHEVADTPLSRVFFHPDCTVGTGISPVLLAFTSMKESSRALPPVVTYTPP